MAIISTPALRKITIAVLVVAVVSFGAAEIHKRFFAPSEQPEQTPTTSVDRFELVESITSTFQKWEEISNSSDKYALLVDPQTGEKFPKVRVGFEFTPLFGDGSGREDATVFAVEKSEDDYEVLGYLKDFTPREVDKLIKPGDRIKIMLQKSISEVGNVRDDGENLLAHWLFIERSLGKEVVEQEIGRTIQTP